MTIITQPVTASKQRVIDKFVVGYGTEFQFKISVTPYGYPTTPDLIVTVNGIEIKNETEQTDGYYLVGINSGIYVDLENYLTNLLTNAQPIAPVVEVSSYTHVLLDPAARGYFEIPQQLEANPTQQEVLEISGSDLINQFSSLIQNQLGIIGSPFGGSNNYRDTRKNRSVGSYILQNVAPTLKTMLISSDDNLDLISAIRFSQQEYTKFKNKYLQTALQLINQEFSPVQYHNNTIIISAWVDAIIKIINVSKEFSNAFAYSYMIANGTPFATETDVVPISGLLTLTNYLDLNDPRTALYIYDVSGQETLLTIGVDYEIVSTNLIIEIQFSNLLINSNVYIALYTNPVPGYIPAYVPSTPTKVGAYTTYIPRIELDNSYVNPTNVIIGHDGSKTIAYGDYRDQLLLELEKRIYNLLDYKFRNEYFLPLRLEDIKPGYFRQTRYTRNEYLTITESYLNKWAASNRANYHLNDWEYASASLPDNSPELWKLYNYSVAIDISGNELNLPGNWKGIFQYYYDTIYPDTRPWEMLGFGSMPMWWISQYGSDWSSVNTALWTDLENGVIRQGPSAIFDPVTLQPQIQKIWARPGLSSIIPVNASGQIIPITTLFNVSTTGDPYLPYDGFDNEWTYGDGSPVEQAWMSTSEYVFSIQEILYLMNPGPFGELLFDTIGTELSPGTFNIPGIYGPVRSNNNWQYVQNDTFTNTDPFFAWMRPKNADQIVHAENINGIIQIRYGYQRWISDKILFLGMDITDTFGLKIRTLDINLGNKFAGFTNKDTISTYIESVSPTATTTSLLIPTNNVQVLLHTGQPIKTYSYSGVIIRVNPEGKFIVYGYDLLNSSFTILNRSDAQLIDITVGGTPAPFKTYEFGEQYNPGDIVRYNGIYYMSLGTIIAGKFNIDNWQKLRTLPTVGGVSVIYKPVSEVTSYNIPYGTILDTPQAVFDFLIGWGAFLESQGWNFSNVSKDTNQVSDWLYAAKQYLFWLNTNWAADSSIQLSPAANKAFLTVTRGYPNDVETISNGVYSILDKYGVAIPPNRTITERDGQEISVSLSDLSAGGIYFLQVNASETEHVLMFDNTTSFNDVVYDPLLQTRQQRIRFNGFRSNGWYGKKEAPGYLIIENELVPNYDTIVNAMNYYYDPNVRIDNPSLESLGQHLIGYESKSYLDNLQVSDDVQYLFYRGAIRQKGTKQAFDKLFRSTQVQNNEVIEVYEEWALRVGNFGNTVEQVNTEFILSPEQNSGEVIVARLNFIPSHIGFVKEINILNAVNRYINVPSIVISEPDVKPNDPALTEPLRTAKAYAVLNALGIITRIDISDPGYGYLSAPGVTINSGNELHQFDVLYAVWQGEIIHDTLADNIIEIDVDDTAKWVVRPPDPQNSLEFPITDIVDFGMPVSGYVNFNDITWTSFDTRQTAVNWGTDTLNPVENDTVWIANTFTADWDVYKMVNIKETPYTANPWSVIDHSGSLLLLTNHVINSTLTIASPANSVATANITTGGVVVDVAIINGGTGYSMAPTVQVIGSASRTAVLKTVISNNVLVNVIVINGGYGYQSAPVINIVGVCITQATVQAIVNNGIIQSINITSGGSGYTITPTVLVAPPVLLTAVATATILNGAVIGTTIIDGGTGYVTAPSISVPPPATTQIQLSLGVVNGVVTSVTIDEIGLGYVSTPNVVITGDCFTPATLSLTIANGVLSNVVIVNGGSGYLSAPSVAVDPPNPIAATMTSTITNGVVTSITITNGGSGYTLPPSIIISDQSYIPATLGAVISDGVVTSVKIIDGGSGYMTIPTLNVIGSSVTPAILYPTIANGVVTSVDVINGGGLYTSIPGVTVIGSSITTAVLVPILEYGVITGFTITNGGSGYQIAPTLNIEQAPNSFIGTGANLFPVINVDGQIVDVTIINGGIGYTTADVILPNRAIQNINGFIDAKIRITSVSTTGQILATEVLVPGSGYQPVVNQELFPQLSPSSDGRTDFGNMICLQIKNNNIVDPATNYGVCFSPAGLYIDPTSLITYNSYRLVTLDGVPITSNNIGAYESFTDLLLFKTMRFMTKPIEPALPKYVGIGDFIWVDDVDSKWSVYRISGNPGYWDISYYDPSIEEFWGYPMTYNYGWDIRGTLIFNLYRQQEQLINSSLFESSQVYQSSTETELVMLPIYDPFKSILPAPAKQNITYMLLQDPARYNVTGNARLFTNNITFGEAQVGKLWWDMSVVRYTYYEQPMALDGSETTTDNLVYRRDRWGQIFPGSSIAIYEWTKSSVPPTAYTGTGVPRSTTDWIQIHTSNKFTNITETNYYFWVLNPTTKPNIENRTFSALDVAMLLYTPRSQGFVFFAPIQQTAINNSYMFYNVQEILAYKGDNVQIQYRLAERNDQPHAQWKLFREGDTASLITDQFWNKLVDSLCGYTKLLPATGEWSNGIFIGNDLPWDIYGWDIAAYDQATVPPTDITYGEILPVPNPALSDSEKYGITYRPLQGMFVNICAARKIFVQAANSLLKTIPIKDKTPDWNSNVQTSIYWEYTTWYEVGFDSATPSVVFADLTTAQEALTQGALLNGTIVEVINGTADGRYVLYNVIQLDPTVLAQSFQKIGVEGAAIKLLDTIYTVNNVYNLSIELRQLCDALRTEIFINDVIVYQNELFFSMLNYVLSEQKNPNWAFKTSYIYIKENNIPVNQSRLYMPDQIDNIIGYIMDSKPYHTQIRDYTSTYLISDIAPGTASDSYKINTVIQFGPNFGGPYEDGNWDANSNITDDPLYWDTLSWDVSPENYSYIVDPYTTGNWEVDPNNMSAQSYWDTFWWDISLVKQFISREDVYTVPLTNFDPSKIGYSQLYPYTFDFNAINLNNPQTFITPSDVVGVLVGETTMIYGRDYYVEYNNVTQNYTAYFFTDISLSSAVPLAIVLWNGGGMQPFKYSSNRTEIAYVFPKSDFVINVDTQLPVNYINGIYYPLNNMWDTSVTAVDSIVGAQSATYDMIEWDQNNFSNIVNLPNTISYKENLDKIDNPKFYRNAEVMSGILVNDILAPTINTENLENIVVFVDPATHPATTDILPNPTLIPGVIWINGERIEYKIKTLLEANTWSLTAVHRGTNGTAPTLHTALIPSLDDASILVPNPVWVESGNEFAYRTENGIIESRFDVQLFDTGLFDDVVFLGDKYDMSRYDNSGWDNNVINNSENYRISVNTTVWNALDPRPDPSSGVDGFDQLPMETGGWEVSGLFTNVMSAVPLWYATTPEAMFLQAEPGIAIP